MKKVMLGLLFLALFSLVIAGSSEISTSFNIGSTEVGQDYVPSVGLWDVYGSYIIGLVIVLVIVIVFLKNRNPKAVKKVKRKVKRKIKKRK